MINRLSIERDCSRLVLDYARHVDSGNTSLIADLFTNDGIWQGADGRTMDGKAAISEALDRRERLGRRTSRHVCTNLLIDVLDAHRAQGSQGVVAPRNTQRIRLSRSDQ